MSRAIRLVTELKESNASSIEIFQVRMYIYRLESVLQSMTSQQRQVQMKLWCLKGCMRQFVKTFNRSMLNLCSSTICSKYKTKKINSNPLMLIST